jgi:two-component system sensor histidine kinase DegS
MSTKPDPSPVPGDSLAAKIRADLETLARELKEIEMLVGQVKAESARHEQKRAQAAERVAAPGPRAEGAELREAYAQLVTLTRRAVVMEGQAELLEAKRKSLVRHRAALEEVAVAATGQAILVAPVGEAPAGEAPVGEAPVGEAPAGETLMIEAPKGAADGAEPIPPTLSRVVLSAQEDLRREIARAMHDGPAQSLTNIVLQVQIVERLLDRDPSAARGELHLLVSMVQQTLDTTKSFIFDVRPMVLDDLGLVPTLRRAARDRGRRAHVPVDFDSLGQDRRLPMEIESAVFRILDEALGAYLALGPERMQIRLDWTDELDARVGAQRSPAYPTDEPLPAVPTDDVPDALKQMMQDRHDTRAATVTAAEVAAVIVLPAATRRDLGERASSIGATVEVLAGGGEVRLVVPLPEADGAVAS